MTMYFFAYNVDKARDFGGGGGGAGGPQTFCPHWGIPQGLGEEISKIKECNIYQTNVY